MKLIILAGGFGTRISEEARYKPKPMLEIGGMPILWHIMKIYSHYGVNEFIVCAGYKQHVIKEWFADYFLHTSDVTFDYTRGNNEMVVHNKHAEPWKVSVVDTGLNTMTGGRIKRVRDVDIRALLSCHKRQGKMGTVSMYNFGQNKGVVEVGKDGLVEAFREKSDFDGDLINIGFMVFEPKVFDYIDGDMTTFEKEPLNRLVAEKQLAGYLHRGYWQCMDTLREKQQIEKLWEAGQAPWKLWE